MGTAPTSPRPRAAARLARILLLLPPLLAAGCGVEPLTTYGQPNLRLSGRESFLALPFMDTRTFVDPRDPLKERDAAGRHARDLFVEALRARAPEALVLAPPDLVRPAGSLTIDEVAAFARQYDADYAIAGQLFNFNEGRPASGITARAGMFIRVVAKDGRLVFVGDHYTFGGSGKSFGEGARDRQARLVADVLIGSFLPALAPAGAAAPPPHIRRYTLPPAPAAADPGGQSARPDRRGIASTRALASLVPPEPAESTAEGEPLPAPEPDAEPDAESAAEEKAPAPLPPPETETTPEPAPSAAPASAPADGAATDGVAEVPAAEAIVIRGSREENDLTWQIAMPVEKDAKTEAAAARPSTETATETSETSKEPPANAETDPPEQTTPAPANSEPLEPAEPATPKPEAAPEPAEPAANPAQPEARAPASSGDASAAPAGAVSLQLTLPTAASLTEVNTDPAAAEQSEQPAVFYELPAPRHRAQAKVLVLPYFDRPNPDNLVPDTGGGEVVTALYMAALARDDRLELVLPPPGRATHREALAPEAAIALGRQVGADFVLTGEVVEFRRAQSTPSWLSAAISTYIIATQMIFAEMSGVQVESRLYRVRDGELLAEESDRSRQKYVVQAEKTVRRLAAGTAPVLVNAALRNLPQPDRN